MRWFFHRERDKRYEIVLQELKKTFEGHGGWDILMKLSLLPKEDLGSKEKDLILHFKKLIAGLTQPSKSPRIKYQKFIKELRKIIQKTRALPYNEIWHAELEELLLEFCVTRYYRTHFFSFGHSLLEKLFSSMTLGSPKEKRDHFSNFNFIEESHLIENSKPLIFLERDLRKFDEFILKRNFDSHKYNLPSLLYTLPFFGKEGLKKVKMIRMASPTRESWIEKPHVVEEFKGFLSYLKRHDKKHLYINKQKTWGEEGKRSDKIIELELEYDNFFCVCLPSDGDFYLQTGRFENVQQVEIFKPLFCRMLRGKINSGYYHIPKAWREDHDFCVGLNRVIDDVHALYFENKKELLTTERKLFIDLAYTHLIVYFLQFSKVDSVNITCRDGIDRAGCEQSKLLHYFHIALGIENETESYEELQYLLHLPVYLAKSRPIVPERREFLYKVFETFTDQVKAEIRSKHLEDPLLLEKPHFNKKNYS